MQRIKLLLTAILLFAFSAAEAQCKAKEIVKKWKGEMSPYEYDSFVTDEFTYKNTKQTLDVEFTGLAGLDYKLVFCTSILPQALGITIYDLPKTNKKRKVIHYDESSKDGYLCTFRALKTGTFYIEYDIPVAEAKNLNVKGCVLMLIGISEK